MAVFTETGLQFMPLVEAAAKDGGKALEEVIAGMPAVTQSAADAGDAVADAMSVMARGAKTAWQNACGEISQLLDGKFSGGVREAALKANAYIEFFAAAAVRYAAGWGEAWSKTSGGIQAGFEHAVKNMLVISGQFVAAVFKSVAAPLRRVFEDVAEGATLLWIRVSQGEEAAKNYLNVLLDNQQSVRDMALEPWKDLADSVRQLDWLPSGAEINLDDLMKALETKLAQATKSAAAVGSAAVGYAGGKAAEDASEKIKSAMSAAKNEMLLGGSYRAATMSLRVDYGKGQDKTVQAVNALTAVSEKIRAATEKTANALEGVEDL
jgi:hypothetical protein